MAKNNLIGGSIWDEYSKVVQDRMNNPKFMGELTEEDAKKQTQNLSSLTLAQRAAAMRSGFTGSLMRKLTR